MNCLVSNIAATVSEEVGIDVQVAMRAIQTDLRLERLYNFQGTMGGPGFLKDLKFAVFWCDLHELKDESNFLKAVIKLNNKYMKRFIRKMEEMMMSIDEVTIAIMGFAFKENTDDVTDSPAIYISIQLLKKDVYLRIYDPQMNEGQIRRCFKPNRNVRVTVPNTALEALQGANAICVPVLSNRIATELNLDNQQSLLNVKQAMDFHAGRSENTPNQRGQSIKQMVSRSSVFIQIIIRIYPKANSNKCKYLLSTRITFKRYVKIHSNPNMTLPIVAE